MRKLSFMIVIAFIAIFTSCKKNDLNEMPPHLSETSLRVLNHIDQLIGNNSLKSSWIINYDSLDLADLEAVINWQFADFQQTEKKSNYPYLLFEGFLLYRWRKSFFTYC
jgi:hypothetical protein